MSGILQQGYSLGYVFAACANLGVGGAVETWKTVFGKKQSILTIKRHTNKKCSTYQPNAVLASPHCTSRQSRTLASDEQSSSVIEIIMAPLCPLPKRTSH